LKIVVCVKQVADSEAIVKVEGDTITWGESPMVLNPFDEYAVEAALQLKEKYDAEVTVVSIGEEGETEALKRALAMGADNAILVSDPAFKGNDQRATSTVIANVINKLGIVDLVIFGRQTLDSGSGITPAQTARLLKAPFLGMAGKIELDGKKITIDRILEESKLVVSASMPAVLSVVQAIGEPRYPSFMGIRKAAKAEIPLWNQAEIGGTVPPAQVQHISYHNPSQKSGKCEMILGETPEDIAKKAVARVMEEKVL
jgi:electron transfer flavoprotein beta subunit